MTLTKPKAWRGARNRAIEARSEADYGPVINDALEHMGFEFVDTLLALQMQVYLQRLGVRPR